MRRLTILLGLALSLLPAAVSAQTSASAFTSGVRYDALRRVVGTIAPDPDGAGALRYAATRNTYQFRGHQFRPIPGTQYLIAADRDRG